MPQWQTNSSQTFQEPSAHAQPTSQKLHSLHARKHKNAEISTIRLVDEPVCRSQNKNLENSAQIRFSGGLRLSMSVFFFRCSYFLRSYYTPVLKGFITNSVEPLLNQRCVVRVILPAAILMTKRRFANCSRRLKLCIKQPA